MCAMADCDLDHIDRLLERLEPLHHVDIDLDVEAIVDRIASINKRIKRGMEATLAQYGLTHPDFQVLGTLRLWRSDHRSSPGELAADMELSSGAMTSRLEEGGQRRRRDRHEGRDECTREASQSRRYGNGYGQNTRWD